MRYLKILFLIFICLTNCETDYKTKENLFQFIPQNSQLIIQINEGLLFKEVYNKNSSIQNLSPSNKEIKTLISLIQETSETSSILCFSPIGKDKFSSVLIQKKQFNSEPVRSNSKDIKYSGVNIIEESIDDLVFFKIIINQIEIISLSKLIIENIIRNYNTNQSGIVDQDFYKLANNIETKSVFNILLNKKSNFFLNKFLPRSKLFPNFNENWIALDGNFDSPLVELNGITLTKDSIPSKLGVFKNLKPGKIEASKLIPKSFNSFLTFSIENIPQFADQIRLYSKYYNKALKHEALKKFSSIDELSILDHQEGKAIIIHKSNSNESLVQNLTPEKSYRNISYGKIDENLEALNTILDLFELEFEANFYTSIKDFFILSSQESLIKTIIGSYKDLKTIDNSKNFKSLSKNLSNLHSGMWVSKTNIFNTKQNISNFDSQKYPIIALQWVNDNEISHLHIKFGSEMPDDTENSVINQGNIISDNDISLAPKWLKNHRSKNYDIVFQDSKNILYLYSNNGNLYWKKQLSEQVLGEILQVDLYKNKKLQMAFRTKNNFLILDRNGKIVKPFNKKIKSQSNSLPLSVFDYDKNRNYRFILAQDRSILMLDSKGKKVEGFKFTKTKSSIIKPVKHIRIKGKDFIIIQEENGQINILNRRGQTIVNVNSNLELSKNPIFSYLNTFTSSDIYGNLVQIDTKGNVIKTPEDWADGHQLEMTTKTLVSISENILTIKGIPIKLPYGNYTNPKIFYINNTIYISTTETDSEKVYLFYSNGKLVTGFPVYGTGAADLVNADNDDSIEMIVQSEKNGIIIYQIN